MSGTKILVVEDENIVAMEIRDRLTDLGYFVADVVATGEDAIERMAKIQPDLVLMDIILRGKMDGIQAAEMIRLQYEVPVIYLSALADDATLQRAKITEPFGYIIKPFEEKDLYTIIEMALYKHKMEQKIKEKERWLSTTLNSINDAVITTDASGRIIFMNPVAEVLTGNRLSELENQNFNETIKLINSETQIAYNQPLEKILHPNQYERISNTTFIEAKDGKQRIISDSGAPIKDDSGKINGYVIVLRDITERCKLEADLLKAQKLESIGILAGGIAHDFNNILTAIVGNVSLAKADLNPHTELFDILDEAEKASLQAKNLTQQLLTFAKGGVPLKKETSIVELIKFSATFALKGSNVNCTFSFPENLWNVNVDAGQIGQVVRNLVVNSDQAMPDGGTISITGQNLIIDDDTCMPLRPGKYVQIRIEDTGIGIPGEFLSKIFDPYFTTKKKESGLGLAISYSIIKKHGGHITVESELEKGTKVSLFLPCSDNANQSQFGPPEKSKESKGRILIMDDEESVRNIARRILMRIGFEVEIAANGQEAIQIFRYAIKTKRPFTAVILDLIVPGEMGGRETLNRLKEIDPQVKALVSSGYSNDPIMADHSKFGFCGIVAKPYKVEELNSALNQILLGVR